MSQQVVTQRDVTITGGLGQALGKRLTTLADREAYNKAMTSGDPKTIERYRSGLAQVIADLQHGQAQIEGGLTVAGAYAIRSCDDVAPARAGKRGKASTETARLYLGKDVTSGRVSQLRHAASLVWDLEIDPAFEKDTFLMLAKHCVSGDGLKALKSVLADDTLKSAAAKREALLEQFRVLGWTQAEDGSWSFTAPTVVDESGSGQDTTDARGAGAQNSAEKVESVNGTDPGRNHSTQLDGVEANLKAIRDSLGTLTTRELKRLRELATMATAIVAEAETHGNE